MSEKSTHPEPQVEKRVLGVLEALSSGIRLEIFRLLVTHEPSGLVAGEISQTLGIPPTNLSFHLKAMTQSGLLTVTPEGRFLRYRARIGTVEEVIRYLSDYCCKQNGEKNPSESLSQTGSRRKGRKETEA